MFTQARFEKRQQGLNLTDRAVQVNPIHSKTLIDKSKLSKLNVSKKATKTSRIRLFLQLMMLGDAQSATEYSSQVSTWELL
ncbi:hypothetical protein AYI69_g3705 [Smittium culicis]|uniref:Uncharacterized protein n=1 Tax=Smittium culicis TaxID=133412 RepID=A0A1R1YIY2_9FUNG|nr:hypothetical protein AYI69_g3705 [Smittium culicis]